MCGLSGYIGLSHDTQTKLMLILGLADGIDSRGGHSCGYVSVDENDLRYARKSGMWIRSRLRFMRGAIGEVCMMHARYATCGNKEDPNYAHPFAVRRGGRVVLWGAHNGMVPDAFKSAKENNREIGVDSQEIFELLADKNYEGIRNMPGYGVITWIDTDHRNHVNLCRLASHSDICVVSIKGGGIIWASTMKIIKEALKFAELEADREFKIDEIGRVYRLTANGVFKTKMSGIKVGHYTKWSNTRNCGNKAQSEDSKNTNSPAPDEDENIDEYQEVEARQFGETTTVTTAGSGSYTPSPAAWGKYHGYDYSSD